MLCDGVVAVVAFIRYASIALTLSEYIDISERLSALIYTRHWGISASHLSLADDICSLQILENGVSNEAHA